MGSCTIDQYGYRRQKANPVSRVGVFPYTGEQIDYDHKLGLQKDKIYWVYRGPEELFAPDALESFNGIPIRIGHVMLGSGDPKNGFKKVDDEPADGCIFNVRQSMDMPDVLIAEFAIWTEKMKEVLAKGKVKQLSLGYCCQYVPEQGIYYGQPYQFKQVRLRGNHLALVEHGRCGSSVCVCDEAIITFDSLPEEILKMDKEAEKVEKAKRLAEAVKNCDDQACQDCLDFYDLTPEQRKDALAYVKGKSEKPSEAKATDGCGCAKAKDEVPPPPPATEEVKKEEANKEETPAAAPASEEPKKEETGVAAASPAVATEPKNEESAAAGAVAENKEEKPVQDCGVNAAQTATTPTAQVPLQALQGGAAKEEEKKEDKPNGETAAPTNDEAGASAGATPPPVKPQVPEDNGNTAEQPKTEGSMASKPELGSERDINVSPAKTADDALTNPPNKENSAKAPEKTDGLPHNDEGVAPDNHIYPKVGTADTACEAGKEGCQEEPKKEETPAATAKASEEPKKEETPAPAMDEAAMYAKFAAEYSRAQLLADQVRAIPGVGTFDSATMREVDVARYAAKHIDCLSFACDEADAVVLAAVKGHISALSKQKAAEPKKTFAMVGDEAIPSQPKKSVSAKSALDAYYNKK